MSMNLLGSDLLGSDLLGSALLGSALLESTWPDGPSRPPGTRPLNLVGNTRVTLRWPDAAMSERLSSAHQKTPAIPEMATAASKAVKRDAPTILIVAHPQNRYRAALYSEQPSRI